jgi:hypothetical protein
MTDPFLADSIQRVLAIQIHEIDIIPSQELQLLQARRQQPGCLSDQELQWLDAAVTLHLSLRLFIPTLMGFNANCLCRVQETIETSNGNRWNP